MDSLGYPILRVLGHSPLLDDSSSLLAAFDRKSTCTVYSRVTRLVTVVRECLHPLVPDTNHVTNVGRSVGPT